ncbi:MAG TPA: serine/threonine-protein kinase [Polyangiaceae bacterium]|nr:serine/threonine-protein kinase [Polyangiaceae bacterium]
MGDPLVGRTLGGKFTLESLIGTGAMGSVYRARHVALDALVAVKVMHDDIAVDRTFAERFHREARAASRLDHPNVIRVVDFGTEPDGHLYIVMEYVEGYDLFQVIRRDSPLAESRVVDLLSQALSGIAAAHDMGVVHRDLKPENIMVTTRVGDDGAEYEVVKVCDFGIAQISEAARTAPSGGVAPRTLTARGVLLGTPQYMSPEQARGEVTDARTDVYSVGVILYQLLTGQLPFDGPTPIDTVLKHISEEPVPPTELVPSASPRLEAVCMKALAKRREGRWTSAREMRAALRSDRAATPRDGASAPRGHAATTPTATTAPPTAQGERRESAPEHLSAAFRSSPNRNLAYAAGALAAVALLGVAVFFAGRDGAPRAAAKSENVVAPAAKSDPAPALPGPTVKEAAVATAVASSQPAPKSAGRLRTPKATDAPRIATRRTEDRALAELEPSRATPATVAAVEAVPVATSIAPATSPSSATAPAPKSVRDEPAPFAVHASSLRVKWHVAQVGGGATSGDVTRSLSRAASSWNGCYESGLRSRGRRVEGQGTLKLSCDDQGRIVAATFAGTGMSDVAACVQSSVTGIRIPNADTGEAWATVAVSLAVAD